MVKWEIKLEIEVSDNWINDGANFSDKWRLDQIQEDIYAQLPFAYADDEIIAKASIVSEPSKEEIEEAINRYEEEEYD